MCDPRPDGREAEELRAGIEKILQQYRPPDAPLTHVERRLADILLDLCRLLDAVDARDSLHHCTELDKITSRLDALEADNRNLRADYQALDMKSQALRRDLEAVEQDQVREKIKERVLPLTLKPPTLRVEVDSHFIVNVWVKGQHVGGIDRLVLDLDGRQGKDWIKGSAYFLSGVQQATLDQVREVPWIRLHKSDYMGPDDR